MAGGATATILRRKADRGRASQFTLRKDCAPGKALQDAFRRAAEEELELSVTAAKPNERHATLAELLDSLPEQAFLGILLGPEEGVGLFCLDAAALSAVIEMRTLGRVSKHQSPARRTTRTDAAMVVDLIDRILAEFEAPLLEEEAARWASGWRYQLYLPDPRPLSVVLEEGVHRVLETDISFANGTKEGKALIALPATGRARPRPPTPPDPDSSAAHTADAWSRAMGEAVASAEASFDVVLGRLRLSLDALSGLAVGDRIVFPINALGGVKLVATGGGLVAEGRLGQSGGVRAVKMADPTLPVSPLTVEGSVILAGTLRSVSDPIVSDPLVGEAGADPLGDLNLGAGHDNYQGSSELSQMGGPAGEQTEDPPSA